MEVLEALRREIDALDDRIVDLLAQRQDVVRRVAAVKHAYGIAVRLPERIEQVKERNAARGAALGLDPDTVRRIFGLMIEQACAIEERLIATGGEPSPEACIDPPAAVEKVNLADRFGRFAEHWSPKIVGQVNGCQVKLVKLKGAFVWHHHETEDEMFLVVSGRLLMRFRDREVAIGPGEFIIVPRGTDHQPVADEEVELLLFEPATILNTGNLRNERTVAAPATV